MSPFITAPCTRNTPQSVLTGFENKLNLTRSNYNTYLHMNAIKFDHAKTHVKVYNFQQGFPPHKIDHQVYRHDILRSNISYANKGA